MKTPTPEELRRIAQLEEKIGEALASCDYGDMPTDAQKNAQREQKIIVAALTRWADELERERARDDAISS